mmetsp:Transcript_112737/g.158152  ORF Transcript_112737/g.158152 Transcript_112737/m.158152 type:complete len:628 (+) Transcript_112737:200-2083(+)
MCTSCCLGVLGHLHLASLRNVVLHLIEVQVLVDGVRALGQLRMVLQVLLVGWEPSENGCHCCELCGCQIDIGALAQTVGEVTGGGRHHGGVVGHPRLVAHAKGATGHLGPGTDLSVDGVVALLGELLLVHLGRGGNPQASGQLAVELRKHLSGGTVVANVRHARANEHLVDSGGSNLRQSFGIVRIVGAAQDWLLQLIQVDVDHCSVLGLLVSLHEGGALQPLLHLADTPGEGTGIAVALGDHPLEQRNVGSQVLLHGVLIQLDGAARRGALCGGIRKLEGLLALQIRQAFDLQNAAVEDVLLSLLLHGQQSLLDGIVWDGVDQVTQGHSWLHLAAEANQDRLGHVQGHHPRGGAEGHQAGAGGEGDAQREAGVRVSACSDLIGEQHSVEPGVDDAIARAQGNTAAVRDELWQGAVRDHIHGLWVGGGVAERLHHEVSLESQAGQVLQLVASHGSSGVLGAHSSHAGLAVGSRHNAVNATGLAHHLLSQREALHVDIWLGHLLEGGGHAQVQALAGLVGESTADDQRDAAACLHLVQHQAVLEVELGDDLVGAMLLDDLLIDAQIDEVAHVHVFDIHLQRQCTRVLHGVEKDGRNHSADHEAAGALVRGARDVLAHVPQDRVRGRLT